MARNIVIGPPIPGRQQAHMSDLVYGDNTQIDVEWLHGDGSAKDLGANEVLLFAYNRNTATQYAMTISQVSGIMSFAWGTFAPSGEYLLQFATSPDRVNISEMSYAVPVTVRDQHTV